LFFSDILIQAPRNVRTANCRISLIQDGYFAFYFAPEINVTDNHFIIFILSKSYYLTINKSKTTKFLLAPATATDFILSFS
jgi:hypothetical protein